MSRSVWSLETSSMTICIWESCLHDGTPRCSHLSKSRNESVDPRLFWPCQEIWDFFESLIMQDKIRVHYYDPEAKTSRNNGSTLTCHLQSRHVSKALAGTVMFTVFWDQHGVVMVDLLQRVSQLLRHTMLCYSRNCKKQ